MARKRALRPYEELRQDSLLRLADACEIIFDGVLTPAALRREATKGNLVIERIAGKDFVTPAAIEAMRERCRVGGEASSPAESITTEREARRAKLASLREQLPSRR